MPAAAQRRSRLATLLALSALALLALTPASALACPTCGTATMPGLTGAGDLAGAYPLQYQRSGARLTLEGASERAVQLDTATRPDRLQFFVAGDPMAAPTIAAGFSWQAAPAVGLHVCGPEVTLSVALP